MNNILNYARMLEGVGLSREQAETHIKILSEIMEEKIATKVDLRSEISNLEQRLGFEIRLIESKMTIKIGAMLCASIAVMTALLKFFIH